MGELGWRSRLARLSQRRSKQAGEVTAAVPNCAVGRRPRLDGCGKELGGPKLAAPPPLPQGRAECGSTDRTTLRVQRYEEMRRAYPRCEMRD